MRPGCVPPTTFWAMGLFGGDRPYAHWDTKGLASQINLLQVMLNARKDLERQYDEALKIGIDTALIEMLENALLEIDYEKEQEDKKKLRQMKRELRRR